MDAVYKRVPFSQRPRPEQLDIGMHGQRRKLALKLFISSAVLRVATLFARTSQVTFDAALCHPTSLLALPVNLTEHSALFAEWRHGRGGHLVLPTQDYTMEPGSRWRRLMCIADYKVPNNATLALMPTQQEQHGSQVLDRMCRLQTRNVDVENAVTSERVKGLFYEQSCSANDFKTVLLTLRELCLLLQFNRVRPDFCRGCAPSVL